MNSRVLSTLLLLPLCLVAPSALAAEATQDVPVQGSGFTFSMRSGGALPVGAVYAANPVGELGRQMGDVVNGMIPVQLDGGLFLGSSVYVGASFMYGKLLLAEACPAATSCSAANLRFGVNLSLHLPVSSGGRWSPWLGGGLGYESFKPEDKAFKGVDFNVQLGADYHLSGPVWAGPFAMLTLGKYSNVSVAASHYWLMGGLKLTMRH